MYTRKEACRQTDMTYEALKFPQNNAEPVPMHSELYCTSAPDISQQMPEGYDHYPQDTIKCFSACFLFLRLVFFPVCHNTLR